MDVFRITGGSPLSGTVAASGSKNAALPIMAASLLTDGPIALAGVPNLSDVNTLSLLLGHLGVETKRDKSGILRLATVDHRPTAAAGHLVRRMRASFCVLGPLLARRRQAIVPLPGGCVIGTRPIDLHLKGLAALGAEFNIKHNCVIAKAGRLRGAHVDLAGPCGPTVTGTANVMMAAALARGCTTIASAAREPEIVDLGSFLISMGANVEGLGESTIQIKGVEELGSTSFHVIPDRIEVATLLIAAVITGGSVTVTGADPGHLNAVLEMLAAAGAAIDISSDRISVAMAGRPRPFAATAEPYPGVPTDVQAQLAALASIGSGMSVIRDCVFPDRFSHVAELRRMGAVIQRYGNEIKIAGPASLHGAMVIASDLRASSALLLAALAAHGQTFVRDTRHLERGYDRLEEKLQSLNARIDRLGAWLPGSAIPSTPTFRPGLSPLSWSTRQH